jgi:hypothetical protein
MPAQRCTRARVKERVGPCIEKEIGIEIGTCVGTWVDTDVGTDVAVGVGVANAADALILL